MKKLLLIVCSIYLNSAQSQSWTAVDTSIADFVTSLAVYNGELYASGRIPSNVGGFPMDVAKYDGTHWLVQGGTFNNYIYTLQVYNGELYAAGLFDSIGGAYFNCIAKWNGTNWSQVGSGVLTGGITSLAVYNGELYAGGGFYDSLTLNYSSLEKWNGTNWSQLPSSPFSGDITTMIEFNGQLYVGGNFPGIFGIPGTDNIARWNGSVWSAVGSGITVLPASEGIRASAIYNGELYFTGFFDSSGTILVNHIAKWDGLSWSAVGSGIDDPPGGSSLGVYNNELYLGGQFNFVSGTPNTSCIAKWNGNTWSSVGGGLSGGGGINAFAVYNNELYVGGFFNFIGPITAGGIAKWSMPVSAREISYNNTVNVFPNPATNKIKVETDSKDGFIEVHDVTGKCLLKEVIVARRFEINLDNFSDGIYFLVINQEGFQLHKKIIKE